MLQSMIEVNEVTFLVDLVYIMFLFLNIGVVIVVVLMIVGLCFYVKGIMMMTKMKDVE